MPLENLQGQHQNANSLVDYLEWDPPYTTAWQAWLSINYSLL